MRHLFTVGLSLAALFAFANLLGCIKVTPNAGGNASPAAPTAISSSAQVVKVAPAAVEVTANGSAEAIVTLTISPGYHINANPATFSYLIATEVTTAKTEGINIAAPVYPVGIKKKFQFAEEPLAVYEGDVPIKLKLSAEKGAGAGPRTVPVTVKVQACNEQECFRPASVNSNISLTVK